MIIRTLKELRLAVSWKLIYIGLCDNTVETIEAIDYAAEQIQIGYDKSELYELSGAYSDDYDYIVRLVYDLKEEDADENIERRKIRLAIVHGVIKVKNQNYIDGLMELTALWSKLGFPDDSPHIIQGRGNVIQPYEYFTQKNYNYLYQKHLDWFKKELLFLQKTDK